jgi:hypothetical protein
MMSFSDELKKALSGLKNREKTLSSGKIYIEWDGKGMVYSSNLDHNEQRIVNWVIQPEFTVLQHISVEPCGHKTIG